LALEAQVAQDLMGHVSTKDQAVLLKVLQSVQTTLDQLADNA
jgi:hypothetical protein